ncbi:hypothetical protein CHRY9293_02673 [Chryseobacterium potabilaquae]|uniref:Uncharacterized protein n=2 Tax=Chryseobacterium potabilaquae TaxID=2675057 RepID=A0A6N4X6C8_9FLAO|nr:hypothetical protein CHRY9293_02673 [Chryseobacterium potabilaquae]
MVIVSFIFKIMRLKKVYFIIVLYILSFSTFSIIVNRDIFNAREASWSTYLESEVAANVISSLVPTIMMSWLVIFWMIRKGLDDKIDTDKNDLLVIKIKKVK